MYTVIWNGTKREGTDLENAIARNCTCDPDNQVTCPTHDSFAHSQRFCDGVLTYRHLRERLLTEEWMGQTPA